MKESNEPPGKAKKRGAATRAPKQSNLGQVVNGQSNGTRKATPHDIGEIVLGQSSKRSGGAEVRTLGQVMGNK
jgi:hypothetical protein